MDNHFSFSGLPGNFAKFEASLIYQQHIGTGIGPIRDWEESRLSAFLDRLYRLTHECIAMHNRADTPPLQPFKTHLANKLSRPELIQLTRQLLRRCNRELINGFRQLSPAEENIIATLEQIHNALIGDFYFQHPGMETIDTVHFYPKS